MKTFKYKTFKTTITKLFTGEGIISNSLNELKKDIDVDNTKVHLCFDKGIPESLKTDIYQAVRNNFKIADEYYMPAGEEAKKIESIKRLAGSMLENSVSRSDLIVISGGGAVSDACNFTSSILLRGIPSVIVPTTLLSMVDASIGGKCAINYLNAKNMLGSFYNPLSVIVDTTCLNTLPEKEIKSGLGELLKTAFLAGGELYKIIEGGEFVALKKEEKIQVIYLAAKYKAYIVEKDPFERKKERFYLNYGHTVGHAVEAAHMGTITHGEAVLLGILAEQYIAEKEKGVNKGVRKDLQRIISFQDFGKLKDVDTDKIAMFLKYDKKRKAEDIYRITYVSKFGKPEILEIDGRRLSKLVREFFRDKYYEL